MNVKNTVIKMGRLYLIVAAFVVSLSAGCVQVADEYDLASFLVSPNGNVGSISGCALLIGKSLTITAPLIVRGVKVLIGGALVGGSDLKGRIISVTGVGNLNLTSMLISEGPFGAVSVEKYGVFTSQHCVFRKNRAAHGGAIAISSKARVVSWHNLFDKNIAFEGYGSAVLVRRGGVFASSSGQFFEPAGLAVGPVVHAPHGGYTAHGDSFTACRAGSTRVAATTGCARCPFPYDCPALDAEVHDPSRPAALILAPPTGSIGSGCSSSHERNLAGETPHVAPGGALCSECPSGRGRFGSAAGDEPCSGCGPFPAWRRLAGLAALGLIAALCAALARALGATEDSRESRVVETAAATAEAAAAGGTGDSGWWRCTLRPGGPSALKGALASTLLITLGHLQVTSMLLDLGSAGEGEGVGEGDGEGEGALGRGLRRALRWSAGGGFASLIFGLDCGLSAGGAAGAAAAPVAPLAAVALWLAVSAEAYRGESPAAAYSALQVGPN